MVVAAILASSGCARRESRADLIVLNGVEPETLDPHVQTGQPDARVSLALFEGLMRFDPRTGTATNGLAERWEMSSDGLRYTFHLRANTVWSTGEPITAEDVVYSWRRALDPRTAADYASQLFYLKNAEDFNGGRTNPVTGRIFSAEEVGVHARDERTVEVELKNPTPFFIELCAFQTLAVVPRRTIERFGDQWIMARPLPTSGAYQLDFWRIRDRIRVRKNPRYWDAANTQCDVVDLLPIDTAPTAINLYLTGQADLIWDKALAPTDLMDVLRLRPDCHTFNYLATYFIRFNVTQAPFTDRRVRQALALAVDRQRIVEKITRAGEKAATHMVPDGPLGYTPPEGLGYHPDQARTLLAEAGFPGGRGFKSFQFLFNSSRQSEQIAVELKAMWHDELGIEIELRPNEWKVFLSEQSAMNYAVCSSSWVADYNDPNTFLDMFMSNNGNNRTGWRNARYDELLRTANRELDPPRRMKILQTAETFLVREEVPVTPVYFFAGVTFFDPGKIDGIYFNPIDEHPLRAIRKMK